MELFEKNLISLEKKSNFISEKIKKNNINKNINKIMVEQAQNGEKILSVFDNNRKWYLNSQWSPEIAAEKYAQRYNIRLYGVYFLFGFSDGRCIRELLNKFDDTNKLFICIPDISIFALACHVFDLQDIFDDSRVTIYFMKENNDLGSVVRSLVDYTHMELVEFCILPVYDVLYGKMCEEFMDNILETIRNLKVNKGTHLAFDRLLPQHMLYHMKHMLQFSDIEQLKCALKERQIKEIPAIIVSAGPSLDKNIQFLKKAEGKAFIIAVDASIRSIIQAGVRPDILCSVDPNSPERFLDDLDLKNIYWACNQWTNSLLMEKYAKHIFYYGYYGNKWNKTIEETLKYAFPNIEPGGSVSTEAFMLALYLGFRKIVLIGQDLAFTGGVTHTQGIKDALGDKETYIQSRQIVKVEGIDGTLLDTDYQMWFYKQWFEKAIRIYRGKIEVIDATEGGARIEGAEIRTLSDVIQTECTQEFSMYNIEKEIPPMFSAEKQQELLNTMKTIRNDIILFENKVEKAIEQEEIILKNVSENGNDTSKVTTELQRLAEENKAIEESDILDYISLYAQNEEYELGDSIYADENLTPVQLVEKSLALLKGYQKGAKLFLEDFDQIIMNDEDPINN